jgi:hypothetical protein
MHYTGICEAASPLGVVQMVDVSAMAQYKIARVKVCVRDPGLITPATKITTGPYVYDAYYEVVEVVERGGLLDGNGEVFDEVRHSHLMDVDAESPNKRKKTAINEGEGSQSENLRRKIFFTREKLAQFIQDETNFKLEFELHKMEERLLAA